MRKYLLIACCALVGACGGTTHSTSPSSQKTQLIRTITAPSGQRSYKVKLPNGQEVIQAHDPQLAQPSGKFKALRPATGVPTVEQYDSVTTSTIPRSARYVAGYVNGLYRTWRLLRGHPFDVGISVTSDFRTFGGADCFDMEPGNPPASAAGPWARWQFTQHNTRPCEYTMLSWIPAVNASLRAYGIRACSSATQTHCVREWDANWTYVRHLDRGFACTQWTNHSGGVNRDESACATWFYKNPVKPRPKPKPKPPKPNPYNRQFNSGFQRGFIVHWDRRHHHKVPALGHVVVTKTWQQGYDTGWKAANHH